MNYAIESIDMSDFCRLYSDRWEKEYKTENSRNRKGVFRDHRVVNGVIIFIRFTIRSRPGDFRGTFSYLKHFNNRRDFIRAKI